MPEAIEQCRKRLGNSFNGCEITYHLNNGRDLKFLNDRSISMVYCWDSAVHFNRAVLESYVKEFARVLKPGGKGFVHHSNLGNKASKNIKNNPLWRSNVSKQFFAEICSINGLKVEYQIDIPWGTITDSATVFSKPTL